MKKGAVASAAIGLLTTYVVTQYPSELRALRNDALLKLTRSQWISEYWLSEQLKYVLEFEKKFESMAKILPDDRKRVLCCLIIHYLRLLNEGQQSTYLTNFRQSIDDLFDLNLEYHEPLAEGSSAKLRNIVSHDYPQVASGLNNYINQLTQYLNDREKPKPHPLLLIGPPGVGKTRFIEEILAPNLNVRVHRVSLAKVSQDELSGEKNANLCNKHHAGILMNALLAAKRQNNGKLPVFVYFDDICTAFTKSGKKVDEQVVLSWLTEVTDPERKSVTSALYNKYGIADITISGIELFLKDFIFIFAANSPHFILTDGLQRRLRNRVTFPPMTAEKKLEIARSYITARETTNVLNLNRQNLPQRTLEVELNKVQLTEQEKRDIDAIAKMDPFPGADTMKDTIDQYYANKIEAQPFDIQAHYQNLQPQVDLSIHDKTFTPCYDVAENSTTQKTSDEVDVLAKKIAEKLSLLSEKERLEKLEQLQAMGLVIKTEKKKTIND